MAQLNIAPALAHFNISTRSYVQAVQEIRMLIDLEGSVDMSDKLQSDLRVLRPIERAKYLINGIFGVELDKIELANYDEACITAQALIEHAFKTECVIEDVDLAMMAAQQRVKTFMEKPTNKFLIITNYNKGTTSSTTPTVTEKREIVEGVSSDVAITTEGKFKKGEKERLAEEIYKDWLAKTTDPTNNQEVIKLFMEKLGMSKAGATTYNYNMKKKLNPSNITAKPKRAK